mmetsp:Transcript_0/g.2  ORF Transcript_0/g.2 Transcript_0/m.2 type:complete len:209 (-) Transcript_0:837-1463(-)
MSEHCPVTCHVADARGGARALPRRFATAFSMSGLFCMDSMIAATRRRRLYARRMARMAARRTTKTTKTRARAPPPPPGRARGASDTSIVAPFVSSMASTTCVVGYKYTSFGGVMCTVTCRDVGADGLAKKPAESVNTGKPLSPTLTDTPATPTPFSSRTKPRTDPNKAFATISKLALTWSSTILSILSSCGHLASSTSIVKSIVPVFT